MSLRVALLLSFSLLAGTVLAQQSAPQSPNPGASPPPTQMYVEPALAYTPSLDVTAMDRSADPCVDFYQYSCGGWQKNNPIPAGPDLVERLWQAVRRQSEISAGHSGAGLDGKGPRRRHPEDWRLLRCLHGRDDGREAAAPSPSGPLWSRSRESRTFASWLPWWLACIWKARPCCSVAAPSRIRTTPTR